MLPQHISESNVNYCNRLTSYRTLIDVGLSPEVSAQLYTGHHEWIAAPVNLKAKYFRRPDAQTNLDLIESHRDYYCRDIDALKRHPWFWENSRGKPTAPRKPRGSGAIIWRQPATIEERGPIAVDRAIARMATEAVQHSISGPPSAALAEGSI